MEGLDFRINVGEYEVLQSGVVLTHQNKGIQFHIGSLTYDVVYEKNEANNKPSIKTEGNSEDNKYLKIVLINYDNSLGVGLVKPVEMGMVNGKALFLHFITSTLSNTDTRVFEYTWLTKEKGDNKNE